MVVPDAMCVGTMAPWTWWKYCLQEEWQAAWAGAFGSVAAVIVAIGLFIGEGARRRKSEGDRAKHAAYLQAIPLLNILQNLLALVDTVLATYERVGAVLPPDAAHFQDYQGLLPTVAASGHFSLKIAHTLQSLTVELGRLTEGIDLDIPIGFRNENPADKERRLNLLRNVRRVLIGLLHHVGELVNEGVREAFGQPVGPFEVRPNPDQ